MELNNTLMTNRSEFIGNFSLKEAFGKIRSICDFFEDTIGDLSKEEKYLISALKNPEKADLFNEFEFFYASEKAKEWKSLCDGLNTEDKNKIKQSLILLELAENDGADITADMIVSGIGTDKPDGIADEADCSFDFGCTEVINLTNHVGTVKFDKYNYNETISEQNKISVKTFVNNSQDSYNDIIIEVFDETTNEDHIIKLGKESSITASFIGNRLVSLNHCISLGEDHLVAKCGNDYKYLNTRNNDSYIYNAGKDKITFFSATNDGVVFIQNNQIKLFSDEQVFFNISLNNGEIPVMVCVRENRYTLLTNYGRLLTNSNRELSNICYVTMKENGDWYAVSALKTVYCNGTETNVPPQPTTNFESIVFGGKKGRQSLKSDIAHSAGYSPEEAADIFDSAVFYGKAPGYSIVETTREIIIHNNESKVIKYEK